MKNSTREDRLRFIKRICFLGLTLILLTGCWDRIELEDLYLSVGEALDQEEDEQGKKLFTLTIQSAVGNPVTKKGKQSPQGKPFKNVSITGKSVSELYRQSVEKTGRIAYGHHLKVLVIGEEIARTINLQNALNVYFRSFNVRRSLIVLIAEGQAKNTFEIGGGSITPALHLLGIVHNQNANARILPPMTLARISEMMTVDSSFLIQRVKIQGEEAKLSGAAVIKGKENKLIGYLNERELEGLNFITGEVKVGMVNGFDQKEKQLISYEIQRATTKIQPYVEGKKIFFDVNIEVDGRLNEDWLMKGNVFEDPLLKRLEKVLQQEVSEMVSEALIKMQKEYQVDVAGFGNQLRIKYPEVWEKVKKDWDKEFSQATVQYKVKLHINEYGSKGTKKSEV